MVLVGQVAVAQVGILLRVVVVAMQEQVLHFKAMCLVVPMVVAAGDPEPLAVVLERPVVVWVCLVQAPQVPPALVV